QALTEALIDFEGALVVVSHDRHLLRSTTDEFYLVHDHKVEPFDGDLDDYQKWLAEEQKLENQPIENNNTSKNETVQNISAQDRKEQKRRDAELRALMQPIKKQLQKEEQKLELLTKELQVIEQQLTDPTIYDNNKKSELTQLLLKQSQLKNKQEETEMNWLDLQQQLEDFNCEN
ncbi:MAG: hypothetical protein M3Z63_07880, partial [Gilliamella apicola]|nr:hypothetical protein [Gilliamella apicola]